MKIKAGDTAPSVGFDLNADVSGASVTFRAMNATTQVAFQNGTATITDAPNGIGTYTFNPAPASEMTLWCEVIVTYGGGAVQRFPQRGYLEVSVQKAVA